MEKFYRRPWLIVAIILAITAFFAFQLRNLELDNNNYRFVPKSDPARITSEFIDETFGSQVIVLVGLERKYDTVLSPDFLAKIREYDARVKKVERIGEVNSLLSTDYITSDGESIVVEPIVPASFAGTKAEIDEVKRRVLSWDMYQRALVSDDLTSTQIVVSLDVETEDAGSPKSVAALGEIESIAHEIFDGTGTAVYVTGLPVFSAQVNKATNADITMLIPLVVLVVLLVLFFSFRRPFAILMPIITVLIATIWSMGAMPLFGIKMSVLSTVLPVILVAVGSAYGIHVVTHYIDERELRGPLSKEEHEKLVFELIRKIGKPVFLAALTTFAGFISFCFTNVLPIREFGYFSSFGVVVSFIVAVTFIPALFLIRGPIPLKPKMLSRKPAAGDGIGRDALSDALATSLVAVTNKKRSILALCALTLVLSLVGLSRLIIDNVMVEYFKEGTDIVQSDNFIRRQFGGSKIMNVVVQSEKPGDVLDPDVLVAMDGLATYLTEYVPEVGKVTSFTDLVKRINQVYNADESPDGLTASYGLQASDGLQAANVASPAANAAESSSDGLGDFGFGDFGSFKDTEITPVAAPPAATERESAKLDADSMVAAMDRAILTGSSYSMDANSFVREMRRAVNYEGAAYYEIPSDPAKYGKASKAELKGVISNYMMLLSGDISAYANDPLEPTAIRMNVQLKTVGQIDTDRAIKAIDDYVAANFPKTVKVTAGGTAHVERALNSLVVWSQLSSVFVSLLMVFIIVWVSYRSILAGFIGIVPLSISILLNFAIMGFAGIKLNIGTALVASVSVGIGIDYTIHYLEAYCREWRATGGTGDFLARTFRTSGKAIIINAVSVGAGFAVLLLSQFNMLAQLGFLIAFTMFSSSLIALTVLPVILNWLKPPFVTQERKS